jgi:hypothetical protein
MRDLVTPQPGGVRETVEQDDWISVFGTVVGDDEFHIVD